MRQHQGVEFSPKFPCHALMNKIHFKFIYVHLNILLDVGSYNYEDSKIICWGVTCGLTRVHLDGAYTTVELSNCSFCFSKILYQKKSIWMSLSLSCSFLSTLFLWISKSFYFPVFACETPNSWQYRFVRGTSFYCEKKQGKRKSGFTVHFVGTSRLIRRTCLMWWFFITKGRLLKFGSWEYGESATVNYDLYIKFYHQSSVEFVETWTLSILGKTDLARTELIVVIATRKDIACQIDGKVPHRALLRHPWLKFNETFPEKPTLALFCRCS